MLWNFFFLFSPRRIKRKASKRHPPLLPHPKTKQNKKQNKKTIKSEQKNSRQTKRKRTKWEEEVVELVRKNHKCGLQQQTARNMGIEVTHCHRQIITYEGGGEQRCAGSDGGGLARQRVFSSSFCFVLFRFSAQTKEPTEPKNIAHPKTRNHLKFTTIFF